MSKELRILPMTAAYQDCPSFIVRISLIMLLQISIKLQKNTGDYWRKEHAPVNDLQRTVIPSEEK